MAVLRPLVLPTFAFLQEELTQFQEKSPLFAAFLVVNGDQEATRKIRGGGQIVHL